MEQNEDTEPASQAVSRGFNLGTILALASLAATLLIWSHTVFVGLVDWTMDLDRRVSVNTQARIDSEKHFEHWTREVIANRRGIDETKRDLADLRTVPQSRPDPFTGSEGRELQQRLDHLERQLKQP